MLKINFYCLCDDLQAQLNPALSPEAKLAIVKRLMDAHEEDIEQAINAVQDKVKDALAKAFAEGIQTNREISAAEAEQVLSRI